VTGGYGPDLALAHASGFTFAAEAAARELLDRLDPGSRVLELGCGDGTTAARLVEAGHTVVGIDQSEAMIDLARARVPAGDFRVGSFVDAEIPGQFDAAIAIGEVLGYLLDERASLDAVVARVRRALPPGGLFLFDLAGPGRAGANGSTGWTDGDGWTVAYRAHEEDGELVREIVTFRRADDGTWHRTDETHRLRLHAPDDVIERLRTHGFAAHTLGGYAGEPLRDGWTVYVAD
jgi:SAM-dependent methyltransferase